ncbi:hypothetical protein FCV87_06405 [Vibrio breoganii]|nr:hypothetical protein FCV87_06405 [Vibrio breoganii]
MRKIGVTALGTGFWVLGSGFWVLGSGFWELEARSSKLEAFKKLKLLIQIIIQEIFFLFVNGFEICNIGFVGTAL